MSRSASRGVFLVTTAGHTFWQNLAPALKAQQERLQVEYHDISRVGEFSRQPLAEELRLLQHRIDQVNLVLRNHRVVEMATDASAVAIGTDVTYRTERDEKPQTVRIGEHGSTDAKATPMVMSYDANVMFTWMLGRKKGERFDVPLHNGGELEVEILDIQLPAEPVTFKLAA